MKTNPQESKRPEPIDLYTLRGLSEAQLSLLENCGDEAMEAAAEQEILSRERSEDN